MYARTLFRGAKKKNKRAKLEKKGVFLVTYTSLERTRQTN